MDFGVVAKGKMHDMMKRFLSIMMCAMMAIATHAVPAMKFVRQVQQPDGTTLSITLVGDEFLGFYTTTDGVPVMQNAQGAYVYARQMQGIFQPTATLAHDAMQRNAAEQAEAAYIKAMPIVASERARQIQEESNARRMQRAPGGPNKVGTSGKFTGNKRGIIILVNYTDTKMKHTREEFDAQMNQKDYNGGYHIGSLSDYFYDQSYGQLQIDFDVVGPYTVSQNMAYYGAPSGSDHDSHAGAMVSEALRLADADGVDFSQYDWTGNGEVDQVFVIYAGYSEAMGGPQNSIWPHEWNLSSARYFDKTCEGRVKIDGVYIDTYACSSELYGASGTRQAGIGTAAHEFSHCLGLPDFYDVLYGGNPGMTDWSLMGGGSYNYYSEIPAPYTSYERWFSGWMEPTELKEPCKVRDMKALTTTPEAYVVFNKKTRNEYYLFENHQNRLTMTEFHNWDSSLTGHGMLVLHVDYSASVWSSNRVNTTASRQRMTFLPANGKMTYSAANLYPNSSNREVSNTSVPAAKFYNLNSDGTYNFNHRIEEITDLNKMISFKFDGGIPIPVPDATDPSDITETSFTANWTPVEGATSYDVLLYDQKEYGNDTLLLEDIANNPAFAEKQTADMSSKINDYLVSGDWTAINVFVDTKRLRLGTLGTKAQAGKLTSKLLSAPEGGAVNVSVGVLKYGSSKASVLVRLVDESGTTLQSQTITPPEELTNFDLTFKDVKTNYRIVILTSTQQAYITYIMARKDYQPTLVEGLTGTSYTFTDLTPGGSYLYFVRAIREDEVSAWSDAMDVTLQKGTLQGDLDGDGVLTANDVVLDVDHALNETYEPLGDMNQDEVITGFDVTKLIQCVENDGAVKKAPLQAPAWADEKEDFITTMLMSFEPGWTNTLHVNLSNAGEYVTAQMEITLPEGFVFVNDGKDIVTLAERCASHTAYTKLVDERTLRVLLTSMTLDAIQGNEGELFQVAVQATETARWGNNTLLVMKTRLSNVEGEVVLADVKGLIRVYATGVTEFLTTHKEILSKGPDFVEARDEAAILAALKDYEALSDEAKADLENEKKLLDAMLDMTTGIASTDASALQPSVIYTIDGVRVAQTTGRGLYIINGKKVVK